LKFTVSTNGSAKEKELLSLAREITEMNSDK